MKNILLLARSATSGAALREMEGLRDQVASLPGVARVHFAFAEEGTPSLRSALDELTQAQELLLIVPILMPVEPSFVTGVKRSLQRWQGADTRPWPEIRIAPALGRQAAMGELLDEIPKDAPVRSEAYRRAVASLPCIVCGIQGYSQAAHLPPEAKGMKQSDLLTFPLCCTRVGIAGCHQDYDQYRLFPRAAAMAVGRAWAKDTQRRIRAMGLWPKGLPHLQDGT